MPTPAQLLARLDEIAFSVREQPGALAVIGVGSSGQETARLDEHSDLDFFVLVAPGSKEGYLRDTGWLERAHPLAYSFQNEADGRKVLFEDGIFAEYAVFEPADLERVPFSGGRLVWRRDGVDERVAVPKVPASRRARPIEGHVGEALTNLFVGLHREARGEVVTATRFVQGYAVDRVMDLAELLFEPRSGTRDPFGAERRFERRYPQVAASLPAMMPGYGRNREAAVCILEWLEAHVEVHPRMALEIRKLCGK
ncbi:MAG TPA: hypothetical protein VNT60_06705 [Deinococcales bacterium]|nr:hypothetical protein [Deinococcales bacterium]